MKNINIPPHLTLIVGIILIIVVRTILNSQATISQFVQFLGIILVIVGFAGLVGKMFRKKQKL